MRRLLIQFFLPLIFCAIPFLTAALIMVAIPERARGFYLDHISKSPIDWIILSLGALLFTLQMALAWRALRWQGTGFNERPDRWLTNLAQAAEWFPMLGLIGTVMGILQTFGSIAEITRTRPIQTQEIIALYAPAITATGSGLFMALINLFPTWIVLLGRDLILSLGGGAPLGGGAVMIHMPHRSITRYFIPLIDVMILMFCIFLLMPAFNESEPENPEARKRLDARRVQELEEKLNQLQAELDQLSKREKLPLQQRLAIRVLEINPDDGRLFYSVPGKEVGKPGLAFVRRYIGSEEEAVALIGRHRRELRESDAKAGMRPELHYLIVTPRVDSAFPTGDQLRQYQEWFRSVSHGVDRPGAGT